VAGFFGADRGRPCPYNARLRAYLRFPHVSPEIGISISIWSMCALHTSPFCGRRVRGGNVRCRSCHHVRLEENESGEGVVKGSAAGAGFSPRGCAQDFPRGLGSSDGQSHRTAGDLESREGRGSENHGVSPDVRDCGSVLVLEREIGWRCWTPNHMRATSGAWVEASPSERPLPPPRAPVSGPSLPRAWPAPHQPLLFCIAGQHAVTPTETDDGLSPTSPARHLASRLRA
jgi:hypothetical protein